MAAAICYGSHGGGAEVAFHHQQGAYDTDTLIGALEELRRFLGGQKATLVWDGRHCCIWRSPPSTSSTRALNAAVDTRD